MNLSQSVEKQLNTRISIRNNKLSAINTNRLSLTTLTARHVDLWIQKSYVRDALTFL